MIFRPTWSGRHTVFAKVSAVALAATERARMDVPTGPFSLRCLLASVPDAVPRMTISLPMGVDPFSFLVSPHERIRRRTVFTVMTATATRRASWRGLTLGGARRDVDDEGARVILRGIHRYGGWGRRRG